MYEDAEILDIYREGDRENEAFNLMMRKYSERLYWHIRKMVGSHEDADDLLQTTWIKAWRYLPDFREESRLYTWLYRIATNETLTFLRKEKLRSILTVGYEAPFVDRYCEEGNFDGNEILRKLYKAIATLPPKQRAVFNMRYFEEMKYEDISEIMGVTVGGLKASYHHAYTKIQKILEEED